MADQQPPPLTPEQLARLEQIAADANPAGYFANTIDEETAAELLPALLAEYKAARAALAEAQQKIDQSSAA